jgi:glucose-6-phosphate 1-dehydrogenase
MNMKTNELPSTIFTIFGGAGDLTWRKLVPALFNLFLNHDLPLHFSIIVVDRVELTDDQLREHLQKGIKKFVSPDKKNTRSWVSFSLHIFYQQGDFKDLKTYTSLQESYKKMEEKWEDKTHLIFYMATPPVMFGEIPRYLGESGLSGERERTRIVVEKPIGYDLNSALELSRILKTTFHESQIFRIDHYLGKETVQNILAFRFANPVFEPIWDGRYIDYVTITVAEVLGVEHRGGYYDKAGALRDMVQNHLMQLLCLVAMEPMVSFEADEIRNKKVDVLHAVRPIPAHDIKSYAVRGQYTGGRIDGKEVKSYRQEEGVSPHSSTETFAALCLYVDNWRWHGVPFYLRTGKRLATQVSEVVIQFHGVPHRSFPPGATSDWQASGLTISIQPNEGIVLRFQAKQPGKSLLLKPVDMRFNYQESFAVPLPDAYETLLWDIMRNDATLFMRADQVEAAWQIVTPVLQEWAKKSQDIPGYSAGSWGPDNVQNLLHKGHQWPLPSEWKEQKKKKVKKIK